MLNQFQVVPLDLAPAIASLSLSKAESATVAKACKAISENLMLEFQASPEALREGLHKAELEFHSTGSADDLDALKEAGKAYEGSTSSYPAVQRGSALHRELSISELTPIALRVADQLHAKILESAARVAEAEAAAKTVFSNLDFSASFDDRLQRTFDLLAEDRKRIESQGAALDRLCQWGLVAQNPYL